MPDAIISDIIVILDKHFTDDDRTREAVETLKSLGMTVDRVDFDSSVVEGSIEQSKMHGLQQLDCVDYVRTTFTYYADYPSGDPRDLDAGTGT